MKNIQPKLITFNKVNKLIEQRIFALPRLQRDFVWDGKKAAMLLDSLYKKYPVGIILIWKTKKNNFGVFNQNMKALPSYNSMNNKEVYFIIDGQQRISSIHQIVNGRTIKNSNQIEINFENVLFLLNKKENPRFKYLKRYDDQMMVRVSDILSQNWRTRFHNYSAIKLKQIEKCRKLINNYKFVFLFIEGNDIEDIRVLFIRINSQLTPISKADQAFTYASKFDYKNKVSQVLNGFEESFRKIKRETIQRSFALIYTSKKPRFDSITIQKIIKKINESEVEQKRFNKMWRTLCNSYGISLDYLKQNFCVLNKHYLPSENMLSVLTCFFYYNKNVQPNSYQKKQIKKWFWDTAINRRYSGRGYSKNIINDFIYFKELVRKKNNILYQILEKQNVNKLVDLDYSSGSSFIKGFFCLLVKSKPQYLKNGEPIPLHKINTKLNKRNNHHIFPKKALKSKKLSEKYYNSFLNICFLVFKDNINVGYKPPYEYMNNYRRKRYFKKMLKSHLIPPNSSGLWNNNVKEGYETFLSERLNYICDNINSQAGVKLFEN